MKSVKWNLKFLAETICMILANEDDCIIMVDGKRGKGKCLKKGSKVLMSNGSWENVENIKIGDEIISPQQDGSFVYSKVKNTHSRFEKDMYEVREQTRRKELLYTCAGNHLIPILRYETHRIKGDKKERRNSKQVLDIYSAKKLSKMYTASSHLISCSTSPIEYKQLDSIIEPYSLGVFIGDGSFSSVRTKKWGLNRNLNITSQDKEILNEVKKYYPYTKVYDKKGTPAKQYRFSLLGELSKQLTRVGLEGKRSGEKFIPKECLLSSISYRMKLLAGLIDTDGTVSRLDHGVVITTKSLRLAKDMKYLVFSLGGHSTIRPHKINYKGERRTYYNVRVSFSNPKQIPLLTKKKDKLKQVTHNPSHIAIQCIKTKPDYVYGFELDSPSKWFITDNWMITHNSTFCLKLALYINRIRKHHIPKHKKFKIEKDIVYSREDVLEQINKWNKTIIADEMINVSYKRDFYQESQKKMNKLLNMNRDHCNLFMMCIPNFSDVDSDIKKLTRIRITCVRRGLAIIQTPVNSLYSTDKWDQMNNERTERKWATSSARRPRYGKLTTYKGYLRFNDLPEDMREKYKAIKREKRNELIIKQEKDSLLPSTEIELFVQRLKAGKISEELLTEYCVIKGSKLSQFKSRVNTRLKDVGDEKRIKDYLTKPKKVLMKNSYPGL